MFCSSIPLLHPIGFPTFHCQHPGLQLIVLLFFFPTPFPFPFLPPLSVCPSPRVSLLHPAVRKAVPGVRAAHSTPRPKRFHGWFFLLFTGFLVSEARTWIRVYSCHHTLWAMASTLLGQKTKGSPNSPGPACQLHPGQPHSSARGARGLCKMAVEMGRGPVEMGRGGTGCSHRGTSRDLPAAALAARGRPLTGRPPRSPAAAAPTLPSAPGPGPGRRGGRPRRGAIVTGGGPGGTGGPGGEGGWERAGTAAGWRARQRPLSATPSPVPGGRKWLFPRRPLCVKHTRSSDSAGGARRVPRRRRRRPPSRAEPWRAERAGRRGAAIPARAGCLAAPPGGARGPRLPPPPLPPPSPAPLLTVEGNQNTPTQPNK